MNMSVNPTQNVFEPSRAARLLLRGRTFAVLALLGACISGCGYNTIPTLEEQAKAKWGDVQNQYQRRADLIPNLVATVQGYAKQEKDVLTAVVEARAKATSVKIDASLSTVPGSALVSRPASDVCPESSKEAAAIWTTFLRAALYVFVAAVTWPLI